MTDRFGREIDYIRVSLTDRCNFRCVYCMPEQGFPCTPKDEHLTPDEIVRIVRVAVSMGVKKVRLTGGEPLLRTDLVQVVRELASIPGLEDLSCTTNGWLLDSKAQALMDAGLTRVNISLDTLRGSRFKAIARRGDLDAVLRGIRAAQDVGLTPLKVNCVAMRGVNDCEAPDFAAWTIVTPVHVRFIELMPIRWNLDGRDEFDAFAAHGGQGLLKLSQSRGDMLGDFELRRMFISTQEIRARIEEAHGQLEPAEVQTNGPARTFRVPGAKGTIGFISQITNDFCARCNRLRLTHDGYLRPCLMSDGELDLRTALRSGATDDDLRSCFDHVLAHKPERHYLGEGQVVRGRGMSQIGG